MIDFSHIIEVGISTVVPIVSGLWIYSSTQAKQHERTREELRATEVRTGEKIDGLREYVDEEFVRREVHELQLKHIQQGFEERDQITDALARRLDDQIELRGVKK